jgi:hypothetical protein
VDADGHSDAAGPTTGHLFGKDDRAEVVAALAAVLLRVTEPEQAELAHAREYAVGETFSCLPLVGVRAQLLGDEVADRLTKRVVLSREMQGPVPPLPSAKSRQLTRMSILSRTDWNGNAP